MMVTSERHEWYLTTCTSNVTVTDRKISTLYLEFYFRKKPWPLLIVVYLVSLIIVALITALIVYFTFPGKRRKTVRWMIKTQYQWRLNVSILEWIPFHGHLTRYAKLWVAHAPGTFSLSPRVSDPDMHHGSCATYVPWCMSGSLTSDFFWSRLVGKTFPVHAQPAISYLARSPCTDHGSRCSLALK